MFAFFLQSLISLSLAGVLVFATFTSDFLRGKEQTQKVLIGVFLGVIVISLSMTSVPVGPLPMVMSAISGPLLFAGYLAGPAGILIAGPCAVLYRVAIGDPMPTAGIYMACATPFLGLAGSYLRAAKPWPHIPRRSLVMMLVGYVLLLTVPFFYMTLFSPQPQSLPVTSKVIVIFGLTGTGFILITWRILEFAIRLAEKVNGANELSENLDLAMRVSGMGRFRRNRGDQRPFFDAGMLAMYGLEKSTLPAQEQGLVPISDWESLVFPKDFPKVKAEADRVWRGEQLVGRGEFRVRRPDGALRNIRAVWISDSKNGSIPTRVTGMHMDLTDTREAEKQHRSSLGRLAMVAEELPGIVMELDLTEDKNPSLLYISPKCKEIWGVTDQEFYENPGLIAKMHDPDDIKEFTGLIERCRKTGAPCSHQYKITARDGSTRWLDFHGSFSFEEDGRTLLRAVQLDATKQVEAQRQIQQEREIARRAQKFESIGQLTGGVAHDFNNLLAVILGNLELLRDGEEPENQIKLIDAAIAASLRGADLTRNMLAFARKAPLTPVKLDINDVLREAKNWIGRTLPESVRVETSLLAGLWAVDVDRASLESALLNLTLNARDAMGGRGHLTIETANVRIDEDYIDLRQEELTPGRYVMVAVSDTGPGIAKEILPSIFEPFFTTKPPGVGSGLGLSMTLGFMRQSGGTVQVYSEVGEGTTFKLYFPAAKDQPEPAMRPQSAETASEGAGRRLLLAEDEDDVRNTLVTILERAGYQVTATASGDEAYDTFVANPSFDLLLTDIVMPGELQGTSLAKKLRQKWPELPIVFMSGYASEATVHGNGLRPEDIRLMKPVQRSDLLAAMVKASSQIKES
ncbi:PAS domain-containing protein [Pseudophaeobacter arcticus]|uniref:PAS domain-containing protein n=1 Tax=Pseudophaeobacter arcticus TaxID=385492 RepID=UPI002490C229|nr:PAS domain-containing protein [Pseudophaeobacter arcticus]